MLPSQRPSAAMVLPSLECTARPCAHAAISMYEIVLCIDLSLSSECRVYLGYRLGEEIAAIEDHGIVLPMQASGQ